MLREHITPVAKPKYKVIRAAIPIDENTSARIESIGRESDVRVPPSMHDVDYRRSLCRFGAGNLFATLRDPYAGGQQKRECGC